MMLGANPTATFSAMSPMGLGAASSTPAHVIHPFTAERQKSSGLLAQFNLDFNQSLPTEGESIFTETFENADKFIKSYFKKELPFFKEADSKVKMIMVRKIVAILEREHFNKQTAKNEDKINSARSNKQSTHK